MKSNSKKAARSTNSKDCFENHEAQVGALRAVDCDSPNTKSLHTVLDLLEDQIQEANDKIESAIATDITASNSSKKVVSFNESFTPQQKDKIQGLIRAEKEKKSVPLQYALVLVQHLVEMKNRNLELETNVRELEAKLQEHGGFTATEENDDGCTGNDEDDDSDDDSSSDDSDYSSDDSCTPVEGMNLIEQI